MDWIKISDKKPVNMICALVCNENGFMEPLKAIYYPYDDCWKWDNSDVRTNILLDVTHYIEIPLMPLKND